MSMKSSPWPLLTIALAGFTVGAFTLGDRGRAGSPQGKAGPTPLYFGTGSCETCHTEEPRGYEKFRPLLCRCDEFTRWKEGDKHPDAFKVLRGPRAQQMGKLLKTEITTDRRCLSCHAVWIEDKQLLKDSADTGFSLEDGVSCVVCHGPYKEWVADHGSLVVKWRKLTRADKESQMGMRDLWDPVKRAELCVSCHLGSRQSNPIKFVTHEMYAAGHPPLPGFEVATFCDQMPRHWEYQAEKHDEVKKHLQYDGHAERAHLILVGTAVAFRESMKLLEAEAAECTQADGGRMLDLVHFDCYACHHDLRSPSWRQERGYVGKPGRPQPRRWPVSPLRLLVHHLAANEADAKAQEKVLQDMLAELHAAFDARPFGDPAVVRRVLQKTVLPWAQNLVDLAAKKKPSKTDSGRLAALIPQLFKDRLLDYDEARQVAWMFKTLHDEAHGPPAGAVKEALAAVEHILRLNLPAGKERSIEKELDQNLKTLNDYKPREFQKALAALGAATAKAQR